MQLYILCSTCSIFDDAGDYKFDAKLKASADKVKKGSYFNEPDEFLPPSAESIVKPLAKKFDYTVGKDSVSLPSTGTHKWVITSLTSLND